MNSRTFYIAKHLLALVARIIACFLLIWLFVHTVKVGIQVSELWLSKDRIVEAITPKAHVVFLVWLAIVLPVIGFVMVITYQAWAINLWAAVIRGKDTPHLRFTLGGKLITHDSTT